MVRNLSAQIVQVLIGQHPLVSLAEKNASADGAYMTTTPVPEVTAALEGLVGDRHAGFVKQSDARTPQYPRGTPIRNNRQVCIVAKEELVTMAARMGVPTIEGAWIGANLVVRGIGRLSLLPPFTRWYFPGGATLTLEGECGPCAYPGKAIASRYPHVAGLRTGFPKGALQLRGVVGWVEKAGVIRCGEVARVVVPDPPCDHFDSEEASDSQGVVALPERPGG